MFYIGTIRPPRRQTYSQQQTVAARLAADREFGSHPFSALIPENWIWACPLELVRFECEFLGTFLMMEECSDAEETILR